MKAIIISLMMFLLVPVGGGVYAVVVNGKVVNTCVMIEGGVIVCK